MRKYVPAGTILFSGQARLGPEDEDTMGGRGSTSRTSAGTVANAGAPNAGQAPVNPASAQEAALNSQIDNAFSERPASTDYTKRYGEETGNYMNLFSSSGFQVVIRDGYPKLEKSLSLGGVKYDLSVSFDNRGPTLATISQNGRQVGGNIRAYPERREGLQNSGRRVLRELRSTLKTVAQG